MRTHGIPSNSRPAGTSSASARITTVGNRGARFAPSIFEMAVVCRPVARERSSWDHPRSTRSALRLAAKCWSGLTPGSFWPLAQEAKRHIVNLPVESGRLKLGYGPIRAGGQTEMNSHRRGRSSRLLVLTTRTNLVPIGFPSCGLWAAFTDQRTSSA
jgi:hypothetical protein